MMNLALKSLKDQEFAAVTQETYEQMVGKTGSGEIAAEDVCILMDGADEEEAEEAPREDPKHVYVTPWEGSETDYANVIKLYEGKTPARIVFIHGGCGPGVLAAIRDKKECVCFVRTELRQQALWDSVVLKVVSELTLGENEGFAKSFTLQSKRRALVALGNL